MMEFTKKQVERLKELRSKYVGRKLRSLVRHGSELLKREAQVTSIHFDLDRESLIVSVDKPEYSPLIELSTAAMGKDYMLEKLAERMKSLKSPRVIEADDYKTTGWTFGWSFEELEKEIDEQ